MHVRTDDMSQSQLINAFVIRLDCNLGVILLTKRVADNLPSTATDNTLDLF